MRRLAMWRVALVGASIGVLLSGCGNDEPPTDPPGYKATSVATAWNNHLQAFKSLSDLAKIKLDYDQTSILRTFNDKEDDNTKLQEYTGLDQIGSYYSQLWQDITSKSAAIDVKLTQVSGSSDALPQVRDANGIRTVLVVWNSPLAGYERATGTLVFDSNFKIRVHNIVYTKPISVESSSNSRRLASVSEELVKYRTQLTATDPATMVPLYRNGDSVVQHFEWNAPGDQYKTYESHLSISEFYNDDLWTGLDVGELTLTISDKVDETARVGFILWKSKIGGKYLSVANTFVFNQDFLIMTHTVVTAKPAGGVLAVHGNHTMLV